HVSCLQAGNSSDRSQSSQELGVLLPGIKHTVSLHVSRSFLQYGTETHFKIYFNRLCCFSVFLIAILLCYISNCSSGQPFRTVVFLVSMEMESKCFQKVPPWEQFSDSEHSVVCSVDCELCVFSFPREVQSGLLEVVSPSAHYYPDFSTLRETFGDSKDRVKWRTKQNLDFSFLMLYAQDKGTYYVQLEDDVVAKADYYSSMKTYASQEESKQWLFLEFSLLGFIGKMFRTRDLPMIAEFFLMFHRDKPIDWLLDHILWVKVCNPERDVKDCARQKASMKRTYKPSLFQHVGLHSSLPGKVQQLKDKDFGKQTLHVPHSNPPAAVSSSLKHYQQHSLQRLYAGDDFFWALTPIQGDHVLISFSQDTHVTGFLFRSGNIETSGDKFYNTTVEVLPSNAVAKEQIPSRYKQSDDGFIVIGAFENGVAEGPVDEALLPLSALRLVVHSDSDVWALLSEVWTLPNVSSKRLEEHKLIEAASNGTMDELNNPPLI
uniref:Alpha-1,3-mannosyl-glycoprotein 4-beta-N-acetylglucosaminyltransferase B-like n=1 Tax=Salarias fasciatus TaxID=181472 RepID=A0A672GQD4_SALFA